MKQKRAYKFRFYPTDEQQHILARTFGCARYVYNWALRLRTDAYSQEQKRIGYHETSASLTLLKKQEDHHWLNEVSSVPTQQALRHLDKAFLSGVRLWRTRRPCEVSQLQEKARGTIG